MDDEQLIRLVEVIECDVKLYGMVDVDLAEKMSRDMFDAIKVRVQSSHSLDVRRLAGAHETLDLQCAKLQSTRQVVPPIMH